MDKDYYAILQVAPNAEQGVIDAAYRRLAWKYHPDVNKSPDASERMKDLNEAYRVLGDPVKRAEYDRLHFAKEIAATGVDRGTGRGTVEAPFACDGCGRIDASLRATVFEVIVSIVFLSYKRGVGAGILCRSCRIKRAIGYTFLSLLLGPWGVPWGLLWTLEAVAVNLTGGKQPAEVNAPILKILGIYFLAVDKPDQTIPAFMASLRFQEDADLREVLRRIQAERGAEKTRSVPPKLGLVGIAILSVCVLTAVMVALGRPQAPQVAGSSGSTSPQANNPPPTSYEVTTYEPPTTNRQINYWTPTPDILDRMTPIPPRDMYVCAPVANIRSGPGLEYPVTRQTTNEWYWRVFGKIGEWYYVGYNDQRVDEFMHQSVLCNQPSSPTVEFFTAPRYEDKTRTWLEDWFDVTAVPSPGMQQGEEQPPPTQSVPCDDYLYNRWKNGKSDRYAPPCTQETNPGYKTPVHGPTLIHIP